MISEGMNGKLPSENSYWKWISREEKENDEMRITNSRDRSRLTEKDVLFFKNYPKWNKRSVSLEKGPFCYVMFGVYPFFLNETLDKLHSNQLRRCNTASREKHVTIFSTPWNHSVLSGR